MPRVARGREDSCARRKFPIVDAATYQPQLRGSGVRMRWMRRVGRARRRRGTRPASGGRGGAKSRWKRGSAAYEWVRGGVGVFGVILGELALRPGPRASETSRPRATGGGGHPNMRPPSPNKATHVRGPSSHHLPAQPSIIFPITPPFAPSPARATLGRNACFTVDSLSPAAVHTT